MSLRILIGVAAVATVIACDKMDSPTAPYETASVAQPATQGIQSQATQSQGTHSPAAHSQAARAQAAHAQAAHPQSHERQVIMRDACDPDTFNSALGAGSCVRRGGVTFDTFIAQLTRSERVASWFFAPPRATVRVGDVFVVVNKGGEAHTFTEVEDFAGGIVDDLNDLMHLTTVAPECNNLAPQDFVQAGGTYREAITEAGVEKYQCCIHPWMRLQARVR